MLSGNAPIPQFRSRTHTAHLSPSQGSEVMARKSIGHPYQKSSVIYHAWQNREIQIQRTNPSSGRMSPRTVCLEPQQTQNFEGVEECRLSVFVSMFASSCCTLSCPRQAHSLLLLKLMVLQTNHPHKSRKTSLGKKTDLTPKTCLLLQRRIWHRHRQRRHAHCERLVFQQCLTGLPRKRGCMEPASTAGPGHCWP